MPARKGIIDLKKRYTGKETDLFNRFIEKSERYSHVLLEEISKKLGRTKYHEELTTSDSRQWYAGLEFAVGNARMAVVFPWSNAQQKKEYPVSVYADRKIPGELIGQTLDALAAAYGKLAPKRTPKQKKTLNYLPKGSWLHK
jgi:hypothetical protein